MWHTDYQQQFLATPGQNHATQYEVSTQTFNEVPRWRVIGVVHLTGVENHGQHNVFIDVLDEHGVRVPKQVRVDIFQADGRPRGFMLTDKPPNEPGSNTQMHFNDTLTLAVNWDGLPSERVVGLHTRHPDENVGNTLGHHSYYVVWQRTLANVDPPIEPPVEPPTPPTDWRLAFTQQQLNEIEYCRLYAERFAHNTGDHLVRIVVAKMAELLDAHTLS